jgi:hypothetical protein
MRLAATIIALAPVTRLAQQLHVTRFIAAAFAVRHNMVIFNILRRVATSAHPIVPLKYFMFHAFANGSVLAV